MDERTSKRKRVAFTAASAVMALLVIPSAGQDSLPTPQEMKRLSLEELSDINVEVALVSKRPEKLGEAPASVQVLTQDDIRRSGASTLPEALRLASNLEVAQISGGQWAISARGFNGSTANKLLVMIDGRTVYTPLYSGVFWDVQHVLLEDVDRIEIVSGPGGALWGANAVNGVINIVTKSARETRGGYALLGTGDSRRRQAAGRFGGAVGDFAYRGYVQGMENAGTEMPSGADGRTGWGLGQGGFRADWQADAADAISLQGDFYLGAFAQPRTDSSGVNGTNVLGRWTRTFSAASELQAQFFFDRTSRDIPLTFGEDLNTYDVDIQYRLPLGTRHSLLCGAGYRLMEDEVKNSALLSFLPADKTLQLFSGFAQDQIAVLDKVKLTLGAKFEHNDYSGYETMPSGRVAWTPDDRQTVWAAVSRAVRAPSRIDAEFFIPAAPPAKPGSYLLAGGPDFVSEKLMAYELGYHLQPLARLRLSLSLFYNRYDDLRSAEPSPSGALMIANGLEGDSRGAELTGSAEVTPWWRLRGGYAWFESDIWVKPGHVDVNQGRGEGDDPAHRFSIQSMLDLPADFRLDASARYVSELPYPEVPDYFTFDASLAWRLNAGPAGRIDFILGGADLATARHPEFGPAVGRQEVPRSVYGKAVWRI